MKIDRTSAESKSSTAMAVPWKTIFSLPVTVGVGTRLSARVYGYPTATAALNCPQTLENTLSGISGGRVPFEDYELTKLAWEANPLSPIIGRCLESGRHAMPKWLSLLVTVLGGVTLRFTKMKSIAAAVAQTKNPLAEFNRSAVPSSGIDQRIEQSHDALHARCADGIAVAKGERWIDSKTSLYMMTAIRRTGEDGKKRL